MRIALLADSHANLPGLQAVADDIDRWAPDIVLVAGDVINRGPRPRECLALIRTRMATHGWRVIKGNHEDYVITSSSPAATQDPLERDLRQLSVWTWHQLGDDVAEIAAWPDQLSLAAPDGSEVRMVHASMRHNRDSIFPAPRTTDAELRLKIGPTPPPLLLVGHTHMAFARHVDRTLVVNCGSAGLPFDRDTRPAYARLTWRAEGWKAEIVHVRYDLAQAERDFADSGFLHDVPMARLVLRELRDARSQLFEWARDYEPRVRSGEISVAESVRLQLSAHT